MSESPDLTNLTEAVESIDTLIGFTASGRQRNHDPQWERVTVRPVELRGGMHYQFSYFDGRQDVTRNYPLTELESPLNEVLAQGFANYHVQSEDGDLHVRITKRGKVLKSKGRPSAELSKHSITHNRPKRHLLTPENGHDVLNVLEMLDKNGQVKPTMQPKYRQVNAFLNLLEDRLGKLTSESLQIVDCGCGSAFLTFAAYAYLSSVRERDARLVGIDRNERLIEKCRAMSDRLGWDGVTFEATDIADYDPGFRPDVVLSLHACDTATDEALARAAHWGAELIVAAPCCQQELADQVVSDVHSPILRHGILKHRTADILTDAIRAQLLRIAGYRADVVEFISTEETSKNLMIRAERGNTDLEAAVREYRELKEFWGVKPSLETYLGDLVSESLESASTP